jgi:hypothetical protein
MKNNRFSLKNIAQDQILPAPIQGLNLNDALSNMPPMQAYVLDNLFPQKTYLSLRNGFASHATAMGSGVVGTVAEYANGATRKLLAGANGRIYDASSAGAGSSLASGFTSNYWQTIMQGGKLLLYNGADTPQQYDGATVSAATYTGISTPANLIQVTQYRSRLYLVEKNFLGFYYGGVNSVTGALTRINLDTVFRRGGSVLWVATFTRDAGDGQDDLFVVASDNNEMLIYEGAYPDDPSWNRIGLFQVPQLLGRRSFVRLGSDLLLLTSAGVIPLTSVMQMGTTVNENQKLTNLINQQFPSLAKTYGANDGWSMAVYSQGEYMLINVPINPSVQSIQYVVNLQTGAWCRFTNQNANSWAVYNSSLYFGGMDGVVYKADTGGTDNGSPITFEMRQAYNLFNSQDNKLFSGIQPIIVADSSVSLNIDIDVDFQNAPYSNTVTTTQSDASPWDTSPWDTTPWAGDANLFRDWYTVGAYGVYGSVRMKGSVSNVEMSISSFKVLFENGGII